MKKLLLHTRSIESPLGENNDRDFEPLFQKFKGVLGIVNKSRTLENVEFNFKNFEEHKQRVHNNMIIKYNEYKKAEVRNKMVAR